MSQEKKIEKEWFKESEEQGSKDIFGEWDLELLANLKEDHRKNVALINR